MKTVLDRRLFNHRYRSPNEIRKYSEKMAIFLFKYLPMNRQSLSPYITDNKTRNQSYSYRIVPIDSLSDTITKNIYIKHINKNYHHKIAFNQIKARINDENKIDT